MSDSLVKELLFASIVSFGYQTAMLERYKQALKNDDSWKDAVEKSEAKIREMLADMKETIEKDFTTRESNAEI